MKSQLVEKAKTEHREEQNVSGIDIDNNQKQGEKSSNKSAFVFGVLYVLTIVLVFLVIFEGFYR